MKINPGVIHLFCEQIPEKGDLYLKHYKTVDGYFTEWYIENGTKIIKTISFNSKNSLAISNIRRDKNLIEFAKEKFDINVEEHLKRAGEFVNENSDLIFIKEKRLLNRSKKERQFILLSDELDKKYDIVIHRLTGQLHIYNENSGIYQSYNETEFSAFLTHEYKQKFLADETKKIMGTFTKLIDESEKYIAFENCLLNLNTLETEKFTSKEFVTFQIPFNWNPEARSEYFEDRVKDILVDEERFELFKQILGYCFILKNPHHILVFITGEGANGKTTLMSILRLIFHSSVTAVALQQFSKEFGLQPLLGKRINILSDLPKMTIDDTGFIKAVTGEDPITVSRKYMESVTTILGTKIIGTGNQLPPVNDDSHAFWRRVIHFELTNTFKDPSVKKQLLNDKGGIEWLIYESIKAYKCVATNGWAAQKSEKDKRDDYLKLSNPCLYAAEQLFVKTNDPEDTITKDKVVQIISEYLQMHELTFPNSVKPYYQAIQSMGGNDIEKSVHYKTIRIIQFHKT